MKTLIVSRRYNAPIERVWEIISDVGGYARYAPNIDTSKIVSGDGKGLIRECSSKEGRWQETCTEWQPLSSYEFEVQTNAKDYPFPFKRLHGRWLVVKTNDISAQVQMKFDVEFKHPLMGILLYPLMKIKFLKVCEKLLDNWEAEIFRTT